MTMTASVDNVRRQGRPRDSLEVKEARQYAKIVALEQLISACSDREERRRLSKAKCVYEGRLRKLQQ